MTRDRLYRAIQKVAEARNIRGAVSASYWSGFSKTAESHGVDPYVLMKVAFQNKAPDTPAYMWSAMRDVAERNPYGSLNFIETLKSRDPQRSAIAGVETLTAPETGLWDSRAGSLTTQGTNIVNGVSARIPAFRSVTPRLVNNVLRPAIDQNGRVNQFGTNAITRIRAASPDIEKIMKRMNTTAPAPGNTAVIR